MEKQSSRDSGVAAIKAEFLSQDHARELNLEFVAANDKKRIANGDNDSEKPPRKKLKGQNKHRPRSERAPRSEKLCFKLGTDGFCPFGDSCCYSHNIATYLSNKLPDISSTCYLYRTFGKCPYTFSCRYGSDHIKDSSNEILTDVWNKMKEEKFFVNSLSKDLQKSLRKRDYNFSKSDEALKKFNDTNKSNTDKNKVSEDEVKKNDVSEDKVKNDVSLDKVKKNDVSEDEQKKNDVSEDKVKKNDVSENTEKSSISAASNSANTTVIVPKADESNTKEIETSSVVQTTSTISTEQDCTELKLTDSSVLKASDNIKEIDDTYFKCDFKKIDFSNKLYLAPLTTVGNLPFRRICKEYGADITCSEMSIALSLLQGQQSEWALLKRHPTEDIFGIQLCGGHPDVMTRCCQVLSENISFDFIDLNLGCPLDPIYKKGAGCGLMNRMKKLEGIIYGVSSVISVPLTVKMRTGIYGNENLAHNVISKVKDWGNRISLITLHGRSREQRYTKSADWDYTNTCNKLADPIPLFGNGDILSYEDYNKRKSETGVSGIMIARGALIKPWIFKEIKEKIHWDITSNERLDILKRYTNYGLEHWGSDSEGVEKTRRFILEWLSFLYRYIPVGLLERLPQRINERPPAYFGRNDLETLMASPSCSDWVKISEMLLGPVPENFIFLPKHKANAYK